MTPARRKSIGGLAFDRFGMTFYQPARVSPALVALERRQIEPADFCVSSGKVGTVWALDRDPKWRQRFVCRCRTRSGAIIVEQHLMDHDPSTGRQTLEALRGEKPVLVRRPAVENQPAKVKIG